MKKFMVSVIESDHIEKFVNDYGVRIMVTSHNTVVRLNDGEKEWFVSLGEYNMPFEVISATIFSVNPDRPSVYYEYLNYYTIHKNN